MIRFTGAAVRVRHNGPSDNRAGPVDAGGRSALPRLQERASRLLRRPGLRLPHQ